MAPPFDIAVRLIRHSGLGSDGLNCNHGMGIFKKHLASASFAFRDFN